MHDRAAPAPVSAAVHVASVSDPDHMDDEPVVEHLIDDAVVADTHPIRARSPLRASYIPVAEDYPQEDR